MYRRTRPCYVDYEFNYKNGTLKVGLTSKRTGGAWDLNRQANIDFNNSGGISITDPANNPADSNLGCNTGSTSDFGDVHFRFKDGKIETDESKTKEFNPNGCTTYNESTGELLDYKIKKSDETCDDLGTEYSTSFEQWCIDQNKDGTCDSF